jgi:hypothetical protein
MDRHGYGLPIPAGSAPGLEEAAAVHTAALAPAEREDRVRVLMALRSATIVRDEDQAEARASFALLREHLADVPLDILEAACRAYCNAPGPRYFPRSAGELRVFVTPLLGHRRSRAWALRRLAEEAERQDARAAELEADPLTPDDIREIMKATGLSAMMSRQISGMMGGRSPDA